MILATIDVLGSFLSGDTSIPGALGRSNIVILGIALHLRQVERLHLHALHHLRHGFLVLIRNMARVSRACLGWQV